MQHVRRATATLFFPLIFLFPFFSSPGLSVVVRILAPLGTWSLHEVTPRVGYGTITLCFSRYRASPSALKDAAECHRWESNRVRVDVRAIVNGP